MLPIKKLYIDSRDRTPDSKSASNFKIELPNTVQMPDNTVFFVTDVCIPHVWQTIEENFNDKLYLYYHTPSGSLPAQLAVSNSQYVVIKIPEGNYTLASLETTLPTLLTNALNATARSFTSFVVSSDALNQSLTISMTGSSTYVWFKFLTDREVSTTYSSITWGGESFDRSNPQSANDIFKFVKPMEVNATLNTGFVNLNHINNVYITSPNLGSFNTIFAGRGDNNIVKKVPVLVNYGYMIVDQVMSTNDYLDCSKQTLQTIEFHLKTAKGDYIPLHGAHVSFSIVFNRYNPNQ